MNLYINHAYAYTDRTCPSDAAFLHLHMCSIICSSHSVVYIPCISFPTKMKLKMLQFSITWTGSWFVFVHDVQTAWSQNHAFVTSSQKTFEKIMHGKIFWSNCQYENKWPSVLFRCWVEKTVNVIYISQLTCSIIFCSQLNVFSIIWNSFEFWEQTDFSSNRSGVCLEKDAFLFYAPLWFVYG